MTMNGVVPEWAAEREIGEKVLEIVDRLSTVEKFAVLCSKRTKLLRLVAGKAIDMIGETPQKTEIVLRNSACGKNCTNYLIALSLESHFGNFSEEARF